MSTKSEKIKKREAALEAAKKKKRIKIIVIIAAVLLIAALIAGGIYYFLQMKVDLDKAVGIEGVDLYFGETEFRVKRDLGSPDRTEDIAEDVDWFDYYYDDMILFGHKAVLHISFMNNKLYYARAEVLKDKDSEIVSSIVDHMTEVFESREEFEKSDLLSEYQTCTISSKTDDGSISCYIMDEFNRVTVDVVYGTNANND